MCVVFINSGCMRPGRDARLKRMMGRPCGAGGSSVLLLLPLMKWMWMEKTRCVEKDLRPLLLAAAGVPIHEAPGTAGG